MKRSQSCGTVVRRVKAARSLSIPAHITFVGSQQQPPQQPPQQHQVVFMGQQAALASWPVPATMLSAWPGMLAPSQAAAHSQLLPVAAPHALFATQMAPAAGAMAICSVDADDACSTSGGDDADASPSVSPAGGAAAIDSDGDDCRCGDQEMQSREQLRPGPFLSSTVACMPLMNAMHQAPLPACNAVQVHVPVVAKPVVATTTASSADVPAVPCRGAGDDDNGTATDQEPRRAAAMPRAGKTVRFAPTPCVVATEAAPAQDDGDAFHLAPSDVTHSDVALLEVLLGPENAPSLARLRRRAALALAAAQAAAARLQPALMYGQAVVPMMVPQPVMHYA